MAEREARWAVRGVGVAVAALAVALIAVGPTSPVRQGIHGLSNVVIGFELATEPEHVFMLLGAPGDPDREAAIRAMDRVNRLDFAFLLAYPALQLAIAAWLVARGLAPRPLLIAVAGLAAAMSAGDAVENLQLLALSGLTEQDAMLPLLARLRVATAVKWGALFLASAALAPFLWREPSRWRWAALPFGLAALLGAMGPVWPPGVEQGALVVGLGWLAVVVHAWRAEAQPS